MEDGDDLPPFWQPPATLRRRHRRPSPILNSSLIIILLPSLLLLFTVFIIVPSVSKFLPHNNNNPVVNTTPQIPKTISVKKGWDTLNIILVLFAILCGIFAKRNDDIPTTTERNEEVRNDDQIQQPATPPYNTTNGVLLQRSKSLMMQPQWFDHYSHQHRISSPLNTSPVITGISLLRRTVSSDPNMKFTGNSQFQFFDDLDVRKFYPKEEPQPQVKEIPVDTFALEKNEELQSPTISPPQTPPRNPPTPPPPPPPPPPLAKQRRTFQTVPRKELAPPSPPPPPPPPPPPKPPRGREEKKRSSRKRTTKEIASAIVSLYNQGKRKRRMKSSRNQEHRFPPHEIHSQFIPPPSPPPPPPPPPPVFHNWFKKGSKTKKVSSHSSTPTPPPPPKPPLPKRRARGSESPNISIPTPPKPPPFELAEMRFAVVGGGYVNVKVRSAQSSRCGSPEMDGRDEAKMNGGDGERVTCPSPDVNLKADTFIARHHNGWRLEKLNSWREKLNKAGHGPTF